MSILITSIVLAVGISILNITLKEFLLSGIARESEKAFYAADAGMECALYLDLSTQGDTFDVPRDAITVSCMGLNANIASATSGSAQTFQFTWGEPQVCAKVTVIKYYSTTGSVNMGSGATCPMGVECTRVESRGYNKACNDLTSKGTVERALRATY